MDSARQASRQDARPLRAPAVVGLATAVGVLGFLVRLVPVLRGPGGLTGVYAYDDGVHFGAALALVHGRLPYRDLLFLQPPGIVVALSPFALLSGLIGDRDAFVAARIAWMVLGGLIAAGVCLLLRRAGGFAALAGGLLYACYWPAVVSEWTTMLEGLANVFVVAGLALARVGRPADEPGRIPRTVTALLAGVCLGISAAVKIWGVLFVVVVVAGLFLGGRSVGVRRRAAVAAGTGDGSGASTPDRRFDAGAALCCLVGAAVGGTACCLPFLLAAPRAMWRMVVSDQLGRPADRGQPLERLGVALGLPANLVNRAGAWWVVVLAVLVTAVVLVLAARDRRFRVAPALTVVFLVLLVAAPSFYPHYAGVLGVPLAVSLGAALGVVGRAGDRSGAGASGGRAAGRRPAGRRVAVVAAGALLVGLVGSTAVTLRTGARPGPGAEVVAALRGSRGCVTADTPGLLIRADVLSRDLDRGCRVVVDLTGYAYDLDPARQVHRVDDRLFADAVFSYLRSGRLTVVSRLRRGGDLSEASWRVLEGWPVEVRSGDYAVRAPR